MRIVAIEVYGFTYHVAGGPFTLSGGRQSAEQESTIVRLLADDGCEGWGEQCSFSPSYLPGHPGGVHAALELLAPSLLGQDPRRPESGWARLEATMKGHEYAKSVLDIACWDLFGHGVGMAVCDLLGGRRRDEVTVYKAVGLGDPEQMAARCAELADLGYRVLQLKVGSRSDEDVARIEACAPLRPQVQRMIVDANGHWSQHEAISVLHALGGRDLYVEQPCPTTRECAEVRRQVPAPMVLDESLTGMSEVLAACQAHALDAARLKLSRLGGITPARRARDLCATLGLAVTIEDSAGGDVVSAACVQLAASVEPRYLLDGFVPSGEVVERVAEHPIEVRDGVVAVPDGPGLGVAVRVAELGPPIAQYREGRP